MGTRNYVTLIAGGKTVFQKYGQWDGYIDGGVGEHLFKVIAASLNAPDAIANFINKCEQHLVYSTDEEIKQKWVEVGANPNSTGVTLDVSEEFRRRYGSLHRDVDGAELMEMILAADGPVYIYPIQEKLDMDWIEYWYVVNLDNRTLTINDSFLIPFDTINQVKPFDQFVNKLMIAVDYPEDLDEESAEEFLQVAEAIGIVIINRGE